MTKIVQQVGYNAAETESYVGPQRQITVDTDNKDLIIHDGVTPGGHRVMNRENSDQRYQRYNVETTGMGPYADGARGFLTRKADNQYVLRSLTLAVDSSLILTNGDGVLGNPTLGLDATIKGDKTFTDDVHVVGVMQVDGGINADTAGTHFGNVTGNLTGNSTGTHTGPVVGNTAGTHTGPVTGDLSGNSNGTHTGPVIGTTVSASDGFSGNLTGNTNGTHTGAVAGTTVSASTGFSGNLTGNTTGTHTGAVVGTAVSASTGFTGNLTGTASFATSAGSSNFATNLLGGYCYAYPNGGVGPAVAVRSELAGPAFVQFTNNPPSQVWNELVVYGPAANYAPKISGAAIARVVSGSSGNAGLISWGTGAPGVLAEGQIYLQHA